MFASNSRRKRASLRRSSASIWRRCAISRSKSGNRLRQLLGPQFDLPGQIGVDLLECRLGLLACRDVLGNAGQSIHLPRLVANRRLNDAEPTQLAGGRVDAIFKFGSPLDDPLEPIRNPLQDEGPIVVID